MTNHDRALAIIEERTKQTLDYLRWDRNNGNITELADTLSLFFGDVMWAIRILRGEDVGETRLEVAGTEKGEGAPAE